jgi:primosomal protein N' (replication factor Y)
LTDLVSLVSVALPGPWWTNLTYKTSLSCGDGARVRVPVGRGSRVGLVVGRGDADFDGELREIFGVIDDHPLLDAWILKILKWFSETYLCGMGTAFKALLPASFVQGLDFPTGVTGPESGGEKNNISRGEASFIYDPADSVRFARYAELISDGLPTLISCPLHSTAKSMFDFLKNASSVPGGVRDGMYLFPKSGRSAEARAWGSVSAEGGPSVVIGAQSSSMAPLRGVARIIIEDESNNIWRTLRDPVHNIRSLLAKRAALQGAALVLGGRMPSSRAYLRLSPDDLSASKAGGNRKAKKIFFVDLRRAYSPSVKGVQDSLAVSEPLIRETMEAARRGAWSIWILDRKGYAGEIICDECGSALRCARCGGAMRWEAAQNRLCCVVCGDGARIPDSCPNCKGVLLMARRPGLEALLPLANAAVGDSLDVISLMEEGEKIGDIAARGPGLIIGTRAALSRCDDLKVGMVGWIDADGEARSQEYDARVRAFGLIWESRWRGVEPEERVVLLQSRRPARDWQRGLEDGDGGWRRFWRAELSERREFGMPPFTSLIKLEANAADVGGLSEAFNSAGVEYWSPQEGGEGKNIIWIRTARLSGLRTILEPFFHIKRARRGTPRLTVWHE